MHIAPHSQSVIVVLCVSRLSLLLSMTVTITSLSRSDTCPSGTAASSSDGPSPLHRIFAASISPVASTPPPSFAVPVSSAASTVPTTAASEPAVAASSVGPFRWECVWCLLSRLAVSPLPASLASHMPPQWKAASDSRHWKRRIDMKQPHYEQQQQQQQQHSQQKDGKEGPTALSSWPAAVSPPCCCRCGRTGLTQHRPSQPPQRSNEGQWQSSTACPRRLPSFAASVGGVSALDRVSVLHGFLSTRSIPSLLQQTNYSRHELYSIFLRFKSLCCLSASGPDGIDAATFQRGVVRLSVEDERFVSRVFALVDADNSGSIEWEEFLVAMAALEKGSAEIKAKFACQVYDLDGDGFIGRQDLVRQQHAHTLTATTTLTATPT